MPRLPDTDQPGTAAGQTRDLPVAAQRATVRPTARSTRRPPSARQRIARRLLAFYDSSCRALDPHPQERNRVELRHRAPPDRSRQRMSDPRRNARDDNKLGLCAERSWRRLRGFEWLAKVVAGVKFRDGVEVQNVARMNRKNKPGRVAA